MATIITDPIFNGRSCILSSELSCVRASTLEAKVAVALSCLCGDKGAEVCIFSTVLYSFDGVVALDDAGSLVEEFFRSHNLVCDEVKFSFGDASASAKVLYCEYAMPESFAVEKSLLVAAGVQRVHRDSTVAIAAIPGSDSQKASVRVVGHKPGSEELAVVRREMVPYFNSEYTAYFSVADIISWAVGAGAEDEGATICDVLYFSIDFNDAQKLCFIMPTPYCLTFAFRNGFNVKEYIDVAGLVVTKTEVDSGSAVCSGRMRQYDRRVSRSYQVETESLTVDEVHLFEQFIASHEIMVLSDGAEWPVVITDRTCEPSSDDDSLTTIKFTWRFADRRPRLFPTAVDGIVSAHRDIFDDKFSPEYE